MTACTDTSLRKGFAVQDLAAVLCCLLVAGSLLVSSAAPAATSARRRSARTTCGRSTRAWRRTWSSTTVYPPQQPVPAVHGHPDDQRDQHQRLGPQHRLHHDARPGAGAAGRPTPGTGHFIWYGTPFDSLPDVCKCPAMSPALLDPTNPELDPPGPLETNLYQYALSYQTSGTCRAATPVIKHPWRGTPGLGGRNPPIPDPTSGMASAQPDGQRPERHRCTSGSAEARRLRPGPIPAHCG